MRLFIAVPLPIELRERVGRLLPSTLPALKRVSPDLLHVTLAFIGWTAAPNLPDVVAAAEDAVRARAAFELAFDRVGCFPATGRPRVAWLGVGLGGGALAELARAVGASLRARELRFDDRPFTPHVTLARVREEVSAPEARTLRAAVDALRVPAGLACHVDRIAVVESVLSPKGPRYTDRAVAMLV